MPCEDLVDGASPPHLKFVPAHTRANDLPSPIIQCKIGVSPQSHRCGCLRCRGSSPALLWWQHEAPRTVKLVPTLVPVNAVTNSISMYAMAAVGAGYAFG